MDEVQIKMTVPFRRFLVHWRSLVIVLVPLVLSPLIVIGSKVCMIHVKLIILFLSSVTNRRILTVNIKGYSSLRIPSVVGCYGVWTGI